MTTANPPTSNMVAYTQFVSIGTNWAANTIAIRPTVMAIVQLAILLFGLTGVVVLLIGD